MAGSMQCYTGDIAVNVDNQENYKHRRGRAVLMTDDKLFVVGDKGIKKQLKVKRW